MELEHVLQKDLMIFSKKLMRMYFVFKKQNYKKIKQMQYNEAHGITPTQIRKSLKSNMLSQDAEPSESEAKSIRMVYTEPEEGAFAADPIVVRMTRPQLEKSIANTTKLMKEAAKKLDFIQAAQYRDEIVRLQKELELKWTEGRIMRLQVESAKCKQSFNLLISAETNISNSAYFENNLSSVSNSQILSVQS